MMQGYPNTIWRILFVLFGYIIGVWFYNSKGHRLSLTQNKMIGWGFILMSAALLLYDKWYGSYARLIHMGY